MKYLLSLLMLVSCQEVREQINDPYMKFNICDQAYKDDHHYGGLYVDEEHNICYYKDGRGTAAIAIPIDCAIIKSCFLHAN